MSLRLAARLQTAFPSLARTVVNRAAQRPPPVPRGAPAVRAVKLLRSLTWTTAFTSGNIKTAEDFLKAIGRSSDTKLSVESWEELWQTNGFALKKAGLGVRDRRCVLYASIRGDTYKRDHWGACALCTAVLCVEI